MYPIRKVRQLAEQIYLMDVEAPRVAAHCQPGQFLIVRNDAQGERVPLTICDYDRAKGLVTIVFQVMGASTRQMAQKKEGDTFETVVGPLGRPSELTQEPLEELRKKRIVFVAGGVGSAPVYPQVKWLHKRGIAADVILGARNKDLILLREEMEAVASHVYIMTDDGSAGEKGMGTDCLRRLVEAGEHYDVCVAIGPMVMMKYVCLLTRELNIPTIVSMNPVMVDGTGMCGACRVMVGGHVRFACVDGPEFDGHLVDFDGAMKRQNLYKTQEGRALLRETEGDTHKGGGCGCGGEEE